MRAIKRAEDRAREMSDIKSVLSLLCQHLNSSINVMMKPEYFRLAKFNGTAENVVSVKQDIA